MHVPAGASAFVNGRIMPMRPSPRPVEVVIVRGDRIVEVGGTDLLARYADARRVDLAGRILCPGFVDAHHHLSLAALEPRWADVRDATCMGDLASALLGHADAEPDTPWVRAAGWTEIGTGFVPHRKDLDALGLDRPLLVAHYSLHQGVTDTRGLEELGVGFSAPNPDGGAYGRDEDASLNGLLIERAWSDAHQRSLVPYDDPDRWAEHIEAAARSLLRDGITAVHDTACSPRAEAAYRVLARTGRLPVSVLVCPHPGALLAAPDADRYKGPPTGEGSEFLRVGPIKLFADGGVAPAIDVHLGGVPLQIGELFAGLKRHVDEATDRGFRVAVHAIGNAGLEAAVTAFEATARRRSGEDHRFRVEHACLASAGQLRRLARLGGIAVVQPGFLSHLGRQVEGVVFDDAEWLPFGDMRRAGLTMAASSDCPCTFHEPLRTSAHGVSRRTATGAVLDPGQSVPFDDWLWAYTAGAAYAGGQEYERGTLAPGLRADFVVLDGELDADRQPTVAETWVGGRLAYSSPGVR
jgi:predicted amidohydrolase YtcJ